MRSLRSLSSMSRVGWTILLLCCIVSYAAISTEATRSRSHATTTSPQSPSPPRSPHSHSPSPLTSRTSSSPLHTHQAVSKTGAEELLRATTGFIMDSHSDSGADEQQQQQHTQTTPLSILQYHANRMLTALSLPVEYLVHIARSGSADLEAQKEGEEKRHEFHPVVEMIGIVFAPPQNTDEPTTQAVSHQGTHHSTTSFERAAVSFDASDPPPPASYIRLTTPRPLATSGVADTTSSFGLECVNCALSNQPQMTFSLEPGTAKSGVNYQVLTKSPLIFNTSEDAQPKTNPTGDIDIEALSDPATVNPFSSQLVRFQTLQSKTASLVLKNGKNLKDGSTILIEKEGLNGSSSTYQQELSELVVVRSLYLPALNFVLDTSNLTVNASSSTNSTTLPLVATQIQTDLLPYFQLTFLCTNCGLVNMHIVLSVNSTYAGFWDLWKLEEWKQEGTVYYNIDLSADLLKTGLSHQKPDLSEHAWKERADNVTYLAWYDDEAGQQSNSAQYISLAIRLAPRRYDTRVRSAIFEFALSTSAATVSPEVNQPLLPDEMNENATYAWMDVDASGNPSTTTNTSVPVTILSNPLLNQSSSFNLTITHTLYCSIHGKIGQANRTVATCNTTEDDTGRIMSWTEYTEWTEGELIQMLKDVNAIALGGSGNNTTNPSPIMQISPSITNETTCADVWSWFQSNSDPNITNPDPDNPDRQYDPSFFLNSTNFQLDTKSEYEGIVDVQCLDVIDNVMNVTMNSTTLLTVNSTLYQYCLIYHRCYLRSHVCHTWVDDYEFCICPFDYDGVNCEEKVAWQCHLQMVYPAMDAQSSQDDAGHSIDMTCPRPSSFLSRLPATNLALKNAGVNSKVPVLKQSELQKKYEYVNMLDGDRPCVEYPSSLTSNPSIQSPSSSNPLGQQEFRFSIQCQFMPDQDPHGVEIEKQSKAGGGSNEVPWWMNSTSPSTSSSITLSPPLSTWHRISERPSQKTIDYLISNNFTWDVNSTNPMNFTYDLLINSTKGEGIMYAQSTLIPVQLRGHVHNFRHLSDHSQDVVSQNSSVFMLLNQPSEDAIQKAVQSGDTSLLKDTTLGVTFNLSTLPSYYYPGGRYSLEFTLLETVIGAEENPWWAILAPRGLVGNHFAARLIVENSQYRLEGAKKDHSLTVVGIFLLVLLIIAVIGSGYKYYEWRKAEEYAKLVRKAKKRAEVEEKKVEERRKERKREKLEKERMKVKTEMAKEASKEQEDDEEEEEKTNLLMQQPIAMPSPPPVQVPEPEDM